MEPWGTLALMGYSCKGFVSRTRTTQSRESLNNAKIKSKTWFEFVKKSRVPQSVESLHDIPNPADPVAP